MKIKKQSGFSLLELMIVLAIVSILAGVAYPSYTNHVRKSKRADAKVALQNAAQQMEAFYIRNNYRYSPKALDSSLDSNADTGTISSPEGQYTIVVQIPSGTTPPRSTYVLTATAKPNSTQAKDKDCYRFRLDNTGQKISFKQISGGVAFNQPDTCW